MSVPVEVRQLLADLRTHLREKIEPPVYVSDRRLVKAVGLMQVSHSSSRALHSCVIVLPDPEGALGFFMAQTETCSMLAHFVLQTDQTM